MFYITDTELYKNKEEFPVGGFNLVSFYSTNETFISSGGPSGGQVFLFQVRSGRRLSCNFNGKQRFFEKHFLMQCQRHIPYQTCTDGAHGEFIIFHM